LDTDYNIGALVHIRFNMSLLQRTASSKRQWRHAIFIDSWHAYRYVSTDHACRCRSGSLEITVWAKTIRFVGGRGFSKGKSDPSAVNSLRLVRFAWYSCTYFILYMCNCIWAIIFFFSRKLYLLRHHANSPVHIRTNDVIFNF